MKWFSVQRKGRLAVASWHGEIGFGAGGQDFIDAMGDAEEVQLVIDSGGGSTAAALLAAPQLAGRQTTVHVPRLCGSAATLGAVASRRVCCGPDARFLIHGVVDACMGNAAALRHRADELEKLTEDLVALYRRRLRVEVDVIRGWLTGGADHWFTAAEALAIGLVDEILPAPPAAEAPATSAVSTAPQSDGSEELFFDMLIALGRIEVRSKATFARNLNAVLAAQVIETPNTK